MRSRWSKWRDEDHPPVEMRFIDMFMTALGSLVFIALLLVFLLPKTTQKQDKDNQDELHKQVAQLVAENQRLRGMNQTPAQGNEDKDIVRRWFGVAVLTEGCDAGDLELYVRWEGSVVSVETGQKIADALPFDANNPAIKTVMNGNQYASIGSQGGGYGDRRNEPAAFKTTGLRGIVFNGVSRAAGSWSAYVGLTSPGSYTRKKCDVVPYYSAHGGTVAGDRIVLRDTQPYAWLRRFTVNRDGTTSLGKKPAEDDEYLRDLAAFSGRQSHAMCEASRRCGTRDAHFALLRPEAPVPEPRRPLDEKAEAALKSGDSFVECDGCPEMVLVPSGAFVIGSPDGEQGRNGDEAPQTVVRIARVAVGRFPVTFAQWDACVADKGCQFSPSDEKWGRSNQPVINVSWSDAQQYISWLSGRTGKRYRLLSEAEREYVTRADSMTPFWWGATIGPSQANYESTIPANDGVPRTRKRTVVVDLFPPNSFGLFQVHGNVFDWVEDCYEPSYAGLPADGAARTKADCRFRVRRGGSWSDQPELLRAASRGLLLPDTRDRATGFRVARSL